MNIADLRKSYERDELDEDASAADPMAQFQRWFDQALSGQLPEPNAMTLATVGASGRPSTRVVLIKGFDERGIVWYTNYESRKGQELAHLPFAALQFHWVELERTVRIEGRVEKTSAEESDAYYATRPLDSRLGAWASPQSQVISSRAVLVAGAAKAAARLRCIHHGRRTGAVTAWCRISGSSGKAARAACTIACVTACKKEGAWIRERLAP
jgi:pyridoxamine 5'-phosphate oxidase